MDPTAWEAELDRLVPGSSTHGRIEYLVDGGAFFPALVHQIGAAREAIRNFAVHLEARIDAEGLQDRIDRFLCRTLDVGVLDPQDESTAFFPSQQIVEESRARATNVQVTGRARGKTNA